MAITPQNPGAIDTPNTLTPDSAGSVAVPNTLTPESAGSVAVPNTLTPESAGSVSVPNSLAAESAGSVAVPNTLNAETAGSVAVPNTLTSSDAKGLPRALTPTVDINYAAGLFAQNGSAVAESDLITYARASSATYIDRYKKGNKWEYYLNTDYVGSVTNLIGYSEDLSQGGWTLSSATLQSVAVKSPAGTVGVKKLVGDGTSDYHALYKPSQTLAGNTYSVYLKYAGNRHVLLGSHYTSAPKNRGAFFDLLSGTIGQVGDGIAASILPVGDGWYRCSITGGDAPSTIFTVELSSDGDTLSYADDAESGVLVWGTQRTAGEKVLPYVKTLATSASETFTESPRVEYDAATGDCLGALIEQASTNLCLRSEEFDHASWAKSSATITANDTQAPDLTTSADKLQAGSTGTVGPLARQPVAVTATNIYTISAFVKRGEADFIQITFVTGEVINNPKVNFDLSLGVVGTQDADIGAATMTPVGNDWFRITATVEAALSLLTPRFVLIKSATDSRGLTNSWTAGEGLYIWGAQIEQSGVPTSYIPTTTAAVSRLADQVSIPVAGNVPSGDVSFRALFDFLGSLNSHIYRVKSTTDDFRLYKGGTDLFSKSGSRTQTLASNASGAFDVVSSFNRSSNTVECFVDGHSVISDDVGSAAMPNVSGVVGIGNVTPAAANQLNGHIKRFTIYDEALTADEVAQL